MHQQALIFATVVATALAGCMQQRPAEPAAGQAGAVQAIAPVEEQPDGGQARALPGPDSYEYKLLLDPARFHASRLKHAIATLDGYVRESAARAGIAYRGTLTRLKGVRDIAFLDVPGKCTLRKANYVLRLRTKETRLLATLKFRSLDAIAVAAASMRPADEAAKSKFEKDIKPPDEHVYSKSMTRPVNAGDLQNPAALSRLFPPLRSIEIQPLGKLAIVGDVQIHEHVWGKTGLDFGDRKGSMSLTLWYRAADDATPAVAELSFRYAGSGSDKAGVERASRLFERLQRLQWAMPESETKTAYVYRLAAGFCEES
jgi:hypothetical protein